MLVVERFSMIYKILTNRLELVSEEASILLELAVVSNADFGRWVDFRGGGSIAGLVVLVASVDEEHLLHVFG